MANRALLALLLICGKAGAQTSSAPLPGYINTFVGTSAGLQIPLDVAIDSAGDVFIADSLNGVVRRVDGITQNFTRVATPGGALISPTSVAVDAAGDLFIADGGNNLVRKVDHQTGLMTTVAGSGIVCAGPYALCSGDGGLATSATLNGPAGLAVDSIGNLYISDSFDNAVRRVDATTGKITTVAGGSQPTLNTPEGLGLDSAGANLYIADSQNNVVRKVVLSTGVISIVAGNGTAGFSGDRAAAVNAELREPYGARLDTAGNLYVADFGNNRIRFVSAATGVISTLAGTGTAGYGGDGGSALVASFNGPSSVALDAHDNLYIADSANNVIRRVTMTPGPIGTNPRSLLFSNPQMVGTTSEAQQITFINNGSSGYVLSIALSSLDFETVQNDCGKMLQIGASCSVYVVFSPPNGDWGARSAFLVYGDSAGDAPQTVALSGAGISGQAALSSTAMSFGTFVANAAPVAQSLTITNSAGSTLYINGVAISSGNSNEFSIGNSGAPCPTQLAPNASCQVVVQFAPGSSSGTRTASLNLSTSTGTAPAVALTAMVGAPQAVLSAGSLSFGSQLLNTASAAQTAMLTNTGSAALTVSGVGLSGANAGDFSLVNLCGSGLVPGASCQVSVRFTPSGLGTRTATLTFTDAGVGGIQQIALSGVGAGSAQAAVSTGSLSFGSQLLNMASTAQTVTLTNSGSAALSVSGVGLSGANAGDFSLVNLCGSGLMAGASCQVSVRFTPSGLGARAATLTFTDGGAGGVQQAALSGVGTGSAQAALSAGSLTFSYQNLGTVSAAQSVTLTNSGSAPLTMGTVAITGAHASDFSAVNNCGSSVLAGASCIVSVTFTPSADGVRSAVLTVNNAVATQSVTLNGTGSGNYSVPGCTVLSFVAGPNPIYTNNPYGITSINANVTCAYDIRLSSPDGPLFATGNGYSSTLTGNWVTDGLSFFLQQSGNTSPSGTLANLSVQVKTGQGCIATAFTASPNPIVTNNAYGQTFVTADTNCSFDVHIGAPDGPIFKEGRGYSVMQTGNWVQNQMNLYLQQHGDTNPADTLSVLTLVVEPAAAGCTVTTFSAVNNPIITTTRLNTDTIQADASCPYDIRVGGPNGALLGSSQGAMTAQTGNWVVNGLSFFLQLQGNTSSSGTLSTFTINTELPAQTVPSCAIANFSASPNPIGANGGATTVSVNANCAWDLRLNDAAGQLLTSGNESGSAAASPVSDGTLVYLQPQGDTNWQHNLAILKVSGAAQAGSCTALVFSSTPIVADSSFGVTNITADATCPYDIRIGSPDGGLFGSGQGLTSANTGNWVLFGQVFYLQKQGDMTPAGTLATNAAIIIP